jgi:hypothetical protein
MLFVVVVCESNVHWAVSVDRKHLSVENAGFHTALRLTESPRCRLRHMKTQRESTPSRILSSPPISCTSPAASLLRRERYMSTVMVWADYMAMFVLWVRYVEIAARSLKVRAQ